MFTSVLVVMVVMVIEGVEVGVVVISVVVGGVLVVELVVGLVEKESGSWVRERGTVMRLNSLPSSLSLIH